MSARIVAELDDDGGISIEVTGEVIEIVVLARRVQIYADQWLIAAEDDDYSAGAPH